MFISSSSDWLWCDHNTWGNTSFLHSSGVTLWCVLSSGDTGLFILFQTFLLSLKKRLKLKILKRLQQLHWGWLPCHYTTYNCACVTLNRDEKESAPDKTMYLIQNILKASSGYSLMRCVICCFPLFSHHNGEDEHDAQEKAKLVSW